MFSRVIVQQKRFRLADLTKAIRLALTVVMFGLLTTSAWAADSPSSRAVSDPSLRQQLDEIDRSLYRNLIELAKFNARLQLKANRHQWWRDYTYPLGRECGTAVSLAATLIDIRQQVRGMDDKRKISRAQLKNAVRCAIVGNAVSGGSSALELAQNSWVMWKAKQEGFSPISSLAFVKDVLVKIEEQLAERDRLAMLEPPDARRHVIELETRLLRRIRQQLLFEFANWSCHSRDRAWRENTFYTIDALQSFTKMGAGIITMKGFAKPRLVRGAVICALVGNSAQTLNPIVRNLVGLAIRKHQKHKLMKEIAFARPEESEELETLQEQLATEAPSDWLRKVAALNLKSDRMNAEIDRETAQIDRFRQVAQQQSITGPLIGLTGVTSSTLATIAVYGYSNDIYTSLKLGLGGRITQGVGQSFALIDTPYTAVTGIMRKRRLKEQGQLPSQILERRLQRLESQ